MSEYAKKEFVNLNDDAYDKVGYLLDRVTNHEYWDNYFYASNVIGREKYYWATIRKTEA